MKSEFPLYKIAGVLDTPGPTNKHENSFSFLLLQLNCTVCFRVEMLMFSTHHRARARSFRVSPLLLLSASLIFHNTPCMNIRKRKIACVSRHGRAKDILCHWAICWIRALNKWHERETYIAGREYLVGTRCHAAQFLTPYRAQTSTHYIIRICAIVISFHVFRFFCQPIYFHECLLTNK